MTFIADFEFDTLPDADDASLDIERQIGNTPLLSFRRVTKHLPADIRVSR